MALSGKAAALYGIDPDPAVCAQAASMQLFDHVSTDPCELLSKADLIVLCAPLGVLPTLIRDLPGLHPGSAVVMDIGSTKTGILQVMEDLPDRFAPLGGHPMCGKEVRTLSEACADLYQNASFALLPLQRTPQPARCLAQQLVEATDARPIWMDTASHDRWVASISHLPYLVSNCLSAVTPLEASPLVGPGYRSTTRLAVESVEMMIDILKNNRTNVLDSLRAFRCQLEEMETRLEVEDYAALTGLFQAGSAQRIEIINAFQKGGAS